MNRSSNFGTAWAWRTETRRAGRLLGCISVMLAWLAGPSALWAAPNITGFNRLYGSWTNDPGYIYIYGSGFVPYTNASVTFGGVRATVVYPDINNGVQFVQTLVPAGAPAGPVQVIVTINGLQAQSPVPFYVVGAGPYIHDFSPTSGGDSVTVTLNGQHFTGATGVTFNGWPGSQVYAGSDTTLTVVTPAGVTTGPITVTTPKGTFTTSSNYSAPLSITGFSPTKGQAGTNLTITGANFLGATWVKFGSLQVPVSPANDTNLQVIVPAGVTTGPITLSSPVSSFTTSSNFLVIPVITGFSPNSGAPGTPVTIQGANFTDGGATPIVGFNGVQAGVQAGYTASQLTATVPPGATTGPISVTTANGTAASSAWFYLPPGISGFTPGGGAAGSWIKITGTNFAGATAVSFNGSPAVTFSVTNNFTLGAVVPSGVVTGPITVTTPGGTANSGGLTFYGAPTLFTATPSHGLAGTNVLLTGFDLLGATAVFFNGLAASSFTATNNTSLSVLVPPYASSGPISVVTPGGTAVSPSAFAIDTSDLSVAVGAAPSPVTANGHLTYVITVTNSGPYAAPNARLGDTLPALSALVSASTTLGGFSTNTNVAVLVCSFGDLPANGSAVVTLVVKAPAAPGWVTNLASVAADDSDPVIQNNVMTNVTLVQSPPLLSVRMVPTNLIQITWPPDLTNFQLQFKGEATTNPPAWSNVTAIPAISNVPSGVKLTVTETNLGANRFYRLRR